MADTPNTRRLYKSRSDRMLDGICGGVADYFGVDSTLVRIAWVLITLLGGAGILLYLLAMIIMPANPDPAATTASPAHLHERNSKFWGILLVGVGTVWFFGNLGIPLWRHWWGFSWDVLLPVLLILAGVAFIFGGRNSLSTAPLPGAGTPFGTPLPPPAQPVPPSRLYKSRSERKVSGVCGGIGVYFGIDPTLVRLLFVITALASFGIVVVLYIIMALVVPREPEPIAVGRGSVPAS